MSFLLSSYAGFASFITSANGSYFIESVTTTFLNNHRTLDVATMMTRVCSVLYSTLIFIYVIKYKIFC